MHIISGSSRLIYGAAVLLLLFIGIAIGLSLSGLSSRRSFMSEASYSPVGADLRHFLIWYWHLHPLIRFQSRFVLDVSRHLYRHDRPILWRAICQFLCGSLYWSNADGSQFRTHCSFPRRTSALVSQMLAFWFLVPGARGLLSVTNILSEDLQSGHWPGRDGHFDCIDLSGCLAGHVISLSEQVHSGHCAQWPIRGS